MLVLFACGESAKEQAERINSVIATPTAIPDSISTPAPIVAPTAISVPTSVPTPTPREPTFKTIISNMGIMTNEEIDRYSQDLAGRSIENWSGLIFDRYRLPTGEIGMAVSIGDAQKTRPDTVLYDIPEDILAKLEVGQPIRFSGTIKGIGVIGEFQNIIEIQQTKVHGLNE
jgi:hypothetical protein